ncbi:MAG: hypothetical protein MUF21_07655 [Gemmatimonadaceae bacterium]|nr:hypothetical protein [Gemmatimonadaceae bacterium]MCU0626345.1 hypothetical protein [Gemmatimonadaceae bacterium]
MSGTIVCKFGGTSVADAEAIRRSGGIVQGRVAERPIVVVSALGISRSARRSSPARPTWARSWAR